MLVFLKAIHNVLDDTTQFAVCLGPNWQRKWTALYLWETGKREIGHETLCTAAKVLGKSWLWFYQDQEEAPVTKAPDALQEVRDGFRSLVTEEEERIYTAVKMKSDMGLPLSECESRFLESLKSKFLEASGGGLSFCPPAQLNEPVEEKQVINAAQAARAAFLEQKRIAG